MALSDADEGDIVKSWPCTLMVVLLKLVPEEPVDGEMETKIFSDCHSFNVMLSLFA